MIISNLPNQQLKAPHKQKRERKGKGDVEEHMLSSRQRFQEFGTSLAGRP